MSTKEYKCPKCRHPVVWSLSNGREGAKASAHCTKHFTQSRVDFRPETDFFCMWEGVVRRGKNGKIEIFDSDGRTRLR